MLYSIRVHIPFFYRYSRKNNSKSCRYSHEIVALGSNTLADVRDKILCRTDIGICKEVDVPTYKMDPSSVVSAQVSKHSNRIHITTTPIDRKSTLPTSSSSKTCSTTTSDIPKPSTTPKSSWNGPKSGRSANSQQQRWTR